MRRILLIATFACVQETGSRDEDRPSGGDTARAATDGHAVGDSSGGDGATQPGGDGATQPGGDGATQPGGDTAPRPGDQAPPACVPGGQTCSSTGAPCCGGFSCQFGRCQSCTQRGGFCT